MRDVGTYFSAVLHDKMLVMTTPEQQPPGEKATSSSGSELANELIASWEEHQAQSELSRQHIEQLHSPTEIAHTEELFKEAKLLARAMDAGSYTREYTLNFETWDREVDFMEGGEMTYTSSTLLVPDQGTRVYKNHGFLMDSTRSHIRHIAIRDSGSSGNVGDFRANPSDFDTLPELAAHVRDQQSDEMNEVNADFTMTSIRGIYATDYPQAILNAIAAQRHLRERGYDIPVFVYDQKERSLRLWEPQAADIEATIAKLGSSTARQVYSNVLGIEQK